MTISLLSTNKNPFIPFGFIDWTGNIIDNFRIVVLLYYIEMLYVCILIVNDHSVFNHVNMSAVAIKCTCTEKLLPWHLIRQPYNRFNVLHRFNKFIWTWHYATTALFLPKSSYVFYLFLPQFLCLSLTLIHIIPPFPDSIFFWLFKPCEAFYTSWFLLFFFLLFLFLCVFDHSSLQEV